MEMSIKIKLSSGKEIKLSAEEYDELKESFEKVEYVPIYPDTVTYPSSSTDPIIQPYITWTTGDFPEINCPSVWCGSIPDLEYTLTTSVGDVSKTQNYRFCPERGVV